MWCFLFNRGSSPFDLTFQRWSIIYIGLQLITQHMITQYMITLKALRANIMFSVTYWMQGSIKQSRRHDDSLLRVSERYSVQCWSLRENSDNLCTEVLRRAASPVLRD